MDKTIEIPKLTILTKEQVYGDNKLNIFKVIDPKAAVSDTAILRGAYVSNYHVDNDSSLRGRTGDYWLQNVGEIDGFVTCGASIIDNYGNIGDTNCDDRSKVVRAALPYSQIKNLPHSIKTRPDGLIEVMYGYLPGTALSKSDQKTLEFFNNYNAIKYIGFGCTFDSNKSIYKNRSFHQEKQEYYEYNGEIYAKIRANLASMYENVILSNESAYKNEDYVWVKVEPIVWLKHPLDDIMISEKGIISGVRFYKHHKNDYTGPYNGDFNKTELKWFLDNYLSKDILSLYQHEQDLYKKLINDYISKIKYIDLQSKESKKSEEKKTINNFIYLDKDGNTIKKKKIIVKAKRKSN